MKQQLGQGLGFLDQGLGPGLLNPLGLGLGLLDPLGLLNTLGLGLLDPLGLLNPLGPGPQEIGLHQKHGMLFQSIKEHLLSFHQSK